MKRIIPIYGKEDTGLSDEPEVKIDYKNGDERIIITYNFSGYTVSHVTRKETDQWKPFQEIGMSGTGIYSINADPLLPSFGRFVEIPPNYSAVSIRYRRLNRIPDKKCIIPWAGEIVWDENRVRFVKKVHEIDRFFPEKVIEHSGPYYMDGHKVLLVHVRPLQYNPRKKILRIYGKIKVYLSLSRMEASSEDERENFCIPALRGSYNRLEAFSNLILNPSQEPVQKTKPRRDSIGKHSCEGR